MNARERLKKAREGAAWMLSRLVAGYRKTTQNYNEAMQKLELLPFKEKHFRDEMKRQGEVHEKREMKRYNANPNGKAIQHKLLRNFEMRETARLKKLWPMKKSAAEWARNYIEVMVHKVEDGKIAPLPGPSLVYSETDIFFGGIKSRRAWGRALQARKGKGYEFHLHLPPSYTFDIIDGHLVAFRRADRGGAVIPCTWWRNSAGLKPQECPGHLVTTDRERLYGFTQTGTVRIKKGGKR